MGPLDWPDPDRRDDALMRVVARVLRPHRTTPLSPREIDVLRCASHGLGMDETAEVLGVAHSTVLRERQSAFRKLAAKNVTHAVAIAIRQGVL